mgnify:CR=1 FL=1
MPLQTLVINSINCVGQHFQQLNEIDRFTRRFGTKRIRHFDPRHDVDRVRLFPFFQLSTTLAVGPDLLARDDERLSIKRNNFCAIHNLLRR